MSLPIFLPFLVLRPGILLSEKNIGALTTVQLRKELFAVLFSSLWLAGLGLLPSSAARAPGRDISGSLSFVVISSVTASLSSRGLVRVPPRRTEGRHTSSARALRRGAPPRAEGRRRRRRRRCCFLPSAACTRNALSALLSVSAPAAFQPPKFRLKRPGWS